MNNIEYPNFMMWFIKNKRLANLTQVDISRGVHKSEALVSLWCNGKQLPTLDTLILLSGLFAAAISKDYITEDLLLQQVVQNIRSDILLKNGAYNHIIQGEQ